MTKPHYAPSPSSPSQSIADCPTCNPVGIAGTALELKAFSDGHLARAEQLLSQIKLLASAADEELSWDSVLAPVDQIALEVALAGGWASLAEEVHPDPETREAARACRPRIIQFHTDMMMDGAFAQVIERLAALEPPLAGTRRRLLRDLRREFRRNGLALPPDQQVRLRQLNETLGQLEQEFNKNLSEATSTLRVPRERLEGVPSSFLEQHPAGPDGLVQLSTDYPDYYPVMTYALDRDLARELNQLFDSRAADLNLPILDRVLALRAEKAELLGYPSWAAYAVEPRMAHSAERVRSFLTQAAQGVRAPARREYREFQAEAAELGADPTAPIPVYNRLFLEQRLAQKKYGFDGKALSEYFELARVVSGALGVAEQLYSIEFREAADAPRWHTEVRVLELVRHGATVGTLYLDLHPRDSKFKHAAMFEIRPGTRLPSGEYLAPMAALVGNFPKPGAAPALLTLDEVTTLFHELGHALHHLLTREELASYAGTNTAQDFVEVPSQMFEEWCFDRSVLDRFARHHQSGELLPVELFDAMLRSRAFGRALATERQISLAALDFEYHSRRPPFNTDAVFDEVMRANQLFVYPKTTHFQATFGHLMGYDAGYYSYQWSLAIARDVLTRFTREGFLEKAAAQDWLDAVLSRGAGADENALVQEFLGRETNLEAYAAYLAGG